MSSETSVLAQAVLYRELARAFAYPDEALLRDLGGGFLGRVRSAAEALTAIEARPEGAEHLTGDRLKPLVEELHRAVELLPSATVSLAEEHTRLFARQVLCSPYEGSYEPDRTFGRVQGLAELASLYAAFGVRVAEREKELPDHVGVELDFLACLCAKEVYALERDQPERVAVCRVARQRFIEDHVRRWLPLLADRVAKQARLDFYPAVARLVVAAVELDPVGVEVTPEEASTR